MRLSIIVLTGLLLAIATAGHCSWIKYSDYVGEWNDMPRLDISKVLVKNKVSGCGEYRYKESSKNSNEYLLQCSRDGKNWRTMVVWVGINKVQPE